jgi:acyl carrier protein
MTRDDLRAIVVRALTGVAPEIDPARVPPDRVLRQEFDLDSMDFLNFVIALHRQSGVEVPESDYGRLSTLGSAVEYLASRLKI